MKAYSHGEIVSTLGPLTATIVTWRDDSDSLSSVRIAVWVGSRRILSLVNNSHTASGDGLITAKDGK
jgi:hypothetical protein